MPASTMKITCHGGSQGWGACVRAARNKISLWHRRMRTRRALRSLESHRLGDIGLSEQDRRREGRKWFWQD